MTEETEQTRLSELREKNLRLWAEVCALAQANKILRATCVDAERELKRIEHVCDRELLPSLRRALRKTEPKNQRERYDETRTNQDP